MKSCTQCQLTKSLSEFSIVKGKNVRYRNRCKRCRALNEAKRRENPEVKKQIKEYKQKPKNKKRTKNLELQRKFNINIEQYETMLKCQDFKCKICEKTKSDKIGRALAVDHCHKTGKVRGLLCTTCNKGIGYFLDNIELLKNAIKYLKENE